MTDGSTVARPPAGAQRDSARPQASRGGVFATVPLPFLFSVAWLRRWFQLEGADQVQRRLTQRQPPQRTPQVDHVSPLAAPRLEAHEDILLEDDAKGPAPCVATVDRTGAALLHPRAAQPSQQPQVVQQPLQRQLTLQ